MSLLEVHRRELERFRHSMNLVGPGSLDLHFEDCLAAVDGLHLEGEWVDLGSGAGFPGLVLAHCYPDLSITLVESRLKRATFLRHVVMTAGARGENVRVRHVRAENLGELTFRGVTSRAFAPLPTFLGHAARLTLPAEGYALLFLQQGEEVPSGDFDTIVQENHYTVQGKRRRSLLLRRRMPPIS